MEDAFDSDDLDTVAERLSGMQNSLRLLSHVADYQVRRDLSEKEAAEKLNVTGKSCTS